MAEISIPPVHFTVITSLMVLVVVRIAVTAARK
jgi:hypothetical protein